MTKQDVYDLRRDVDKLKEQTSEEFNDIFLLTNVAVFTYIDETYTPASITATSYQSSHDITDFYDGYIVLSTSTDGTTFVQKRTVEGHSLTATLRNQNLKLLKVELFDNSTDLNLLDSQTVTVVRTVHGTSGKGYDFAYYTTDANTTPSAPVGDVEYLTGDYDEWLQKPKTPDATHTDIYMSYRVTTTGETWGDWSTPVKYSGVGEKGEDGEGAEFIFTRTQTTTAPTFSNGQGEATYTGVDRNGHHYQDADFIPDNWTDDQQGVNSTYKYEWASIRTKNVVNGVASWGDFNTPKIWANYSEDGEDTFIVTLGNDTQMIPCDSDGNLIESFTFEVPFYCYKGIGKYPASFNSNESSSEISTPSSWISLTDVDNATTSNNGNLTFRVNSTPSFNQGFLVLAFNVDNQVIYCILSYARTHDGADGETGADGVDGNGYHYIYHRTTTNVAPSTPTSNTTIIIDPTQAGSELDGTEWYEDPIDPTAQFPYLWISYRMFNGQSKTWGAFCTPYIFDTYQFDGSTGQTGDTGTHGTDGSVLTGDDIKDKTTDVESTTMNDSVPSNFVPLNPQSCSKQVGQYTSYVNRQGNVVLINLRGTFATSSDPDVDKYYNIFELPSWAMPIATTYFADVVNDGTYRVYNNNGTPAVQYRNLHPSSSAWNCASSVMYFADDSNKKATSINLVGSKRIMQGAGVTFQLLDDNDDPIANKVIYIKVNGVIYSRTTDFVGTVSLNLNLYGEYQIAVWYDGYEYENGEITTVSDEYLKCEAVYNVFVRSAYIRDISWGTDETKGYYAEIKTQIGIPLRYHDVGIAIDGGDSWIGQTDGDGRVYFDLMGYEGDVEVIATLSKSSRVQETVSEKHTFNKSSLSTFEREYYPTSISTNADYTNLDVANIKSINDSRFIKSVETDYNDTLTNLEFNFDDLNIPLSAIIQSVSVVGRFTSLEGDVQLCRPSWEAPTVTISTDNYSDTLNGKPSGIQWDYTNCGKWKQITYNKTISSSDTTVTNLNEDWKDIKITLSGLTNNGGGNSHQDSGRFAIDYLKLIVNYTIDNTTSTLPVDVPKYVIYAENLTKIEKAPERFYARLEYEGEPVEGETVTFYFNSYSYDRTTDEDGMCSLAMNLSRGNYPIIVSYTDEDDVTYSERYIVSIKPRLWADDLNKVFRCRDSQYEVYVVDDDGNPYYPSYCDISNQEDLTGKVRFNIHGMFYDRCINEKGIATLNINLEAGTYTISAMEENGCTISNEITVYAGLLTEDLVMTYRDGSQFVATILDCQQNPMEGEEVTFNINGVFYKRTTDANGEAKLTINLIAGDYFITTSHKDEKTLNRITIRA